MVIIMHAGVQVLGVFRNLAEEISAFNPHLPDKRRREVQQALLVSALWSL